MLLKNLGHVALGLELLKPQLAEAEDAVDHLLGEVPSGVEVDENFLLQSLEPRILWLCPQLGRLGLRLQRGHWQDEEDDGDDDGPGKAARTHEGTSFATHPNATCRHRCWHL